MAFALGAQVHACIDVDAPIFLDLGTDRYFRLMPEAEGAFLRLARDEPLHAGDQVILDGLVAKGILRPIRPDLEGKPLLLTPRPRLDSELSSDASPSPLILARMLYSRLRVRFCQSRGRRVMLDFIQKSRVPHTRQNEAGGALVAQMVTALARSDILLSPASRCLERALALVGNLRRAGERAELVVGVTARPFAAHCWVQQGPLLLGDRIERVCGFTPIAVL